MSSSTTTSLGLNGLASSSAGVAGGGASSLGCAGGVAFRIVSGRAFSLGSTQECPHSSESGRSSSMISSEQIEA
eukprot:7579927-Pyramimonas_sp.AAC.1